MLTAQFMASLGFSVPGGTATGGTAFAVGIPPFPGPANTPPFIYTLQPNGQPDWWSQSGCLTHITTIDQLNGSTAHTFYIARPKNWTTLTADAAAGQAVVNIAADPGVYTTNYRYPLPGVTPSAGLYTYPGRVANNVIAASDYAAYQLPDGTWVFDTVASVSTLAITMTTNVPTGGVKSGAPFFIFGVPGTDSDPATGQLDPSFKTIVSIRQTIQDYVVGCFTSLHKGDPLLYYNANGTAADVLNVISGFYSQF